MSKNFKLKKVIKRFVFFGFLYVYEHFMHMSVSRIHILVDLVDPLNVTKWYPVEIITAALYAYDPALLANTLVQANYLPHNMEKTVGSIGLYMNSDNTKFIYLNRDDVISSLNDKSLKFLVCLFCLS